MRKVILVRHGKSSWADPGLDDHDRPLNPRGRSASPVIARWLAERGHRPEMTLCSSARRTVETEELMRAAVPALPQPLVEAGLYHASPQQLLERLRALDDAVSVAMLVGHNPGLSATARKLSAAPVRPRCARAFEHFPTAAAAVFVLPIERWRDAAFGEAEFTDYARPRELV